MWLTVSESGRERKLWTVHAATAKGILDHERATERKKRDAQSTWEECATVVDEVRKCICCGDVAWPSNQLSAAVIVGGEKQEYIT